MAYVNQNDSLVLAAGEDSESGFDLIHAEFIQQIRISGLGSSTDNDSTAAEADKTLATDRDKDCSDQVAADALQKTLKLRRDSDVSNAVTSSDESKLFDAGGGSIGAGSGGGGGVTPSLQHCFSGVGSSSSGSTAGSFVFGCISSSSLDKNDESAVAAGSRGRSVSKHSTIGKVYRKIKEPPLNVSFPSKIGSYELKVLKQPEEQHRARYLTEGSRGTVKDQSGQGHPTIKLCGYDQPVALQVFVGTDVGRMKPHGFYQACKVSNKNSTACIERDIEGTTVIEITFDPKQEMVAVVDCVGILKLRNADVEQRIGLAKSKKKSTCARLIFRVNIPKPDGTFHTLQVASSPIICTQPTGAPEISKKSINQCSVKGGEEMFIIGKNFMKGTVVYFEEVKNDQVIWTKEAEIDQDFFQATHLVCTVPSYRSFDIQYPVQIQIIVHSSGRTSDPVSFTYLPNIKNSVLPSAEASIPMETEPAVGKSTQEVSGLKRPYDSSPHSDASYVKSTVGDVSSSDMSHILGAAAAAEFRDVRDDFAESKVIVQNDSSGVSLSGQSLFEGSCGLPVMDSLTKSSVDAFILPLQSLDAVARSSSVVDSIPCFQESKEDAPVPGVYDNLYDSSVTPNLVNNALSRERHLEDQLTNLIEAAHQKMMSSHDGLMQGTGGGRAGCTSLTDQLNSAHSPTEHAGALLGGVQSENSDYGEPQSKRLASYEQANMDMLIQLINADADSQKQKPKDEMNWSGMSPADANYDMARNNNLPPLTGSESHDAHHNSTSAQLENLSSFTMKSFDPSPPSTTSLPQQQQQPVLFDFGNDVMQASFLQSHVREVKPDPNFSGIDAFLHDNVRYTNSSSPQSMDTSGPAGAGLFPDGSHVSLSFPMQAINDKDDKTSVFGIHLRPGASQEPPASVGFRTRSRSSLPESSSTRSSAMSNGSNTVHVVNIRKDGADLVGMDFRDLGHSGFGGMKASGSELHDLLESHHHLQNDAATEINQTANQNLILHHGTIHGPELALLGVSQVSDSEHHLSHIDQNHMHGFSSQDPTDVGKQQQHYSQPGLVEVALTHSFSDGDLHQLDKMSQYIGGLDLPDMDALLHLSSPQSAAAMNSLQHRLSEAPIAGALHQVQIDMAGGGGHLPDNGQHTPVLTLTNIGSITATGPPAGTDNCFSSDDGSMGSNLQQSLCELQDLKQQTGFSDGPQSPTRSGSKTSSSDSTVTADGNVSPKAEFSVSNEHSVLTPPSLSRGQPGQETLHPLSNCSSGNFGSSEMTSLQGSLNYTQTTCNTQTLQDSVSSAGPELYENIFQHFSFLSNSENLNVPMISSSNSSLEATLDSEVLRMHHHSALTSTSQMLTTGDDNVYIGTNGGIVTNTKQQPPQQSLLSQSPASQQRHILLMAPDGSSVVVPLSSVLLSSAASGEATVAAANQKANEYVANESDQDRVTAVTMMDYKRVVGTIMPSGKLVCLPPNLVSVLARKSESELSGSSSRSVLVLPGGSLKQQVNSTSVQMAVGHQATDVSNKGLSPSSIDVLYSMTMSNGNGDMKFMSNSTAVPPPPQSLESDLPRRSQDRLDQPMDTSSPFNHFTLENLTPMAPSQPQQLPCDQLLNNSSCKMPTLLYQLLTTDDARGAVRGGTPASSGISSLPNLSVDDVSQVLDMNRSSQQGQKLH